LSFAEFRQTISFNDQTGEKVNIYCAYAMEFMNPINIIENVFTSEQGNIIPIQIHICKGPKRGFLESNPLRGYAVESPDDLRLILKQISDIYHIDSPSAEAIFEGIGILWACALISARYIPLDFQVMLNIHENKLKVVGFDFGIFEKINDLKNPMYLENIISSIVNSPYIGSFIELDESIGVAFINGVINIMEIFCKIKNFSDIQDEVDLFMQILSQLAEIYGDLNFGKYINTNIVNIFKRITNSQ
jgi:hypothetical protein